MLSNSSAVTVVKLLCWYTTRQIACETAILSCFEGIVSFVLDISIAKVSLELKLDFSLSQARVEPMCIDMKTNFGLGSSETETPR